MRKLIIIALVCLCGSAFGQATSKVIKNPLLNSISVLPNNQGLTYKIADTLKVFNHSFDSLSYKASINRLEIFYKQTILTVTDTIGNLINKAVWLVPETRRYSICNGDSSVMSPEPYDTVIFKGNQIYVQKKVIR